MEPEDENNTNNNTGNKSGTVKIIPKAASEDPAAVPTRRRSNSRGNDDPLVLERERNKSMRDISREDLRRELARVQVTSPIHSNRDSRIVWKKPMDNYHENRISFHRF